MHPAIIAALDEHEKTRFIIESLAPLADDAQVVASQFPGLLPDIRASAVNGAIWLQIFITDMDQLATVRRAMVERGFHLHDRTEHLDCGYFVLDHRRPGSDLRILLQVSILSREGARCRLVKVGEKTVSEYAIKCGEG